MTERVRAAQPLEIVTVLADSTFSFPDPEYYMDIEQDDGGADLAMGLKRMLEIIARPFSPQGSWPLMRTQVSEICRRFPKHPQEQYEPQYSRTSPTGSNIPSQYDFFTTGLGDRMSRSSRMQRAIQMGNSDEDDEDAEEGNKLRIQAPEAKLQQIVYL